MPPVSELLARATSAIAEREPRAALEALRAAWCETPDPRIALAVTELARHAAPTTTEVTAGAWQTVCDRGDPADLGVLLANVVKTSSEAAGERLTALARWRRDPRLGEALVQWLDTPPYSSRSSSAFWLAVAAAIRTCGDPRVVAACDRAVVGTLARTSAGTYLVPRIAAACDALRARVADLEVLNAIDHATVEHLLSVIASWDAAERSREEMEAMFLARVREDPDDDNPRLVFADWLTEHGDERGELIALQFARHDNARLSADGLKRAHALERRHGATWLGSLAHELRRGSMLFDRGFVAEVWIDGKFRNPMKTIGDPAWATVREITVTNPPRTPELLRLLSDPIMRGLRAIRGITLDVLEGMSALALAQQLHHVDVIANHADRDAVLGQLAAGALPALSFLEWTDAPTVTRIEQLMRVPCDHLVLSGVSSKIVVDLRRADDPTCWDLTFELPDALAMFPNLEALSRRANIASVSVTVVNDRLN